MKLLLTLGACLFSGIINATPIHNIIVFGDSLSDNGNFYDFMNHQMPQSPPYFNGRFSNGPVWIEHLASSYFPKNTDLHVQNYAFGGAGVSEEEDDDVLFTLRKEISTYLLAHNDKAQEDSLFVVWIGANNYLGLPSEVEKTLTDVNSGLVHGLERLVNKGAKHILVLNLPDLGRIPAATEFNSVDELAYFAKQHNAALDVSMTELKTTYPAVNWYYFDMNQAFAHVVDNPAEYGFTNTTGTCFESAINEMTKKSVLQMVAHVKPKSNQNSCDGYLFFDLVHPTGLAHKIMAEKAKVMLDAQGLEFSE